MRPIHLSSRPSGRSPRWSPRSHLFDLFDFFDRFNLPFFHFDAGPLRRFVPLSSLILIALILLFVAYQAFSTLYVVIGPRDLRFVSNTHAIETLFDQQSDHQQTMRWTTEESRLDIPLVSSRHPLILDLSLVNGYPPPPRVAPDQPQVTVSVGESEGNEVVSFVPERENRHYRMILPPQERAGWNLPVTIESSTFMPQTDPRPLGVVLLGASLSATDLGMLFPPLWQSIALLLAVTAFYAMMRGFGVPRLSAWVATFIVMVIFLVAMARFPMDILPYTMRIAALSLLGAFYILVVRFLTDVLYDQPWVSLTKLLIFMGVAYWCMPIYQLIMIADGAVAVAPYNPTLWIGGVGLLAIVVGMALLWYFRYEDQWHVLVLSVLGLASFARLIVMLEFVMNNSGVATIVLAIGFLVVAASGYLSRWKFVAVSVVALAVLIPTASLFSDVLGRGGPDFWILFKGAREWVRGGSLYDLVAVQENHFGHVFKVPPFYGMLFTPFVFEDGLMILFWHRIINMILLAVVLVIIIRSFQLSLFSTLGVGLVMLVSMRPLADTVAYGQIDILLLFWLILALIASQRGYDTWAGAAVALGTLFKLYPIILLGFFLAKRQWRAFIGFAVAMIICNGVAVAVMGWEMHRMYLFEVVPRIGGGTAWVENQTLNGFFSRLFSTDMSASIFHHPTVTLMTYVSFGLAALGAMALSLLPADRSSPRYMLQFGVFVVLMVLVVPAAWMHYQTIVVVAFLGLLLYTAEFGMSRWMAALAGLSYALIAYGNQWSFYANKIMGGLTVLGVSYKFYGLVLLLIVIVAALFDEVEQPIFPSRTDEIDLQRWIEASNRGARV
jgi:hypothetical protein